MLFIMAGKGICGAVNCMVLFKIKKSYHMFKIRQQRSPRVYLPSVLGPGGRDGCYSAIPTTGAGEVSHMSFTHHTVSTFVIDNTYITKITCTTKCYIYLLKFSLVS